MFTACGNASKSSETTLSSNDVSISDSTSKSESDETVKYEYKSTEELLKTVLIELVMVLLPLMIKMIFQIL